MLLKTKLLSSLEKVFCDEDIISSPEFKCASALRGEVFAFQLAFWGDTLIKNINFKVESEISEMVSIRSVGYVPCDYVGSNFDDNVLRKTPGLYPDPLYPPKSAINALPLQWRAVWITVRIPEDCNAGNYAITIHLSGHMPYDSEIRVEGDETFLLEILPVTLPKQKLLHTEWFHADCIASYYQTPCWSEKHWELIGKYATNAAAHGINMFLTPLWTPPLDTKVGGERPTTQLLIIAKKGSEYIFDFSRLERWIETLLAAGIKYFEMSHFFTQWGAKYLPKIFVSEDGVEKKLFGWHVAASDPEYKNFLSQLMPPLLRLLRDKQLAGKCFFHVSDEPNMDCIEDYSQAAGLVNNLVEDFPVIDALSNINFYNRGIIKNPIPSSNHIESFVEAGVKPLWTYYCCGQWDKVPNRFFHFPSARNRIMGMLMFKYDIAGFLQWGFNFWFSQYSIDQKLDPFRVTDAGQAFQGGDAFMVYPGEDGPIDSLKYEVFMEGLQDMRALRLLEDIIGRNATIALLEDGLDCPLKMDSYPTPAAWLLACREKINRTLVLSRAENCV